MLTMLHAPSQPKGRAETRLEGTPPRRPQAIAPPAKRGGSIAAISAMLLAFLASQHHTIMMTLLAFGLTDAAMSFMTAMPVVRDAMLGMSLAMIGMIGWQIRDSRRPKSMRIVGGISIVSTMGLAAWSVMKFGL
jgi:hypothetical protein